MVLPLLAFAGIATDIQLASAQDGTLLYVHAHPDDESIFGGGVLPYYAQVDQKNIVSLGMVTRNSNGTNPLQTGGNSRITELENALKIYAGVTTTSTNGDGHLVAGNITFVEGGYIDTGCCDPDPIDSWSDAGDGAGWGTSTGVTTVTPGFGNIHGIADGRQAAAYGVAREIRRYRPDVVITPHDLEGDYGHSNHTATAIAAIDAFTLAADPNFEIEGLAAWQAKKLYLRGDANDDNRAGLAWNGFVSDGGINSLFHDGLEDVTGNGMTSREIADLGLDQHVSQGSLDVSSVYRDNEGTTNNPGLFDGHHSEWWTLYESTVGADTLEDPFSIQGDLTGRTYSGFARGGFFQNISAVPEPSSCLLLVAGTCLTIVRRRRRTV